MQKKRIAVIGAGAAGLFSAACVEKNDNFEVVLFEKNLFPGKKLMITGKGRCNVTNNCDFPEFLANVPHNNKFLYSSLKKFSPQKTIDFFEDMGVPLKTERGKRVFPQSDRAVDIRNALYEKCKKNGAKFIFEKVCNIKKENYYFLVETNKSKHFFDYVILATGGKSYPVTGSTGDGYYFAKKFGHTVTPLRPSLVPLVCEEKFVSDLMGLTLKNVNLTIIDTQKNKNIYSDFGEMIFTHFGISGPLVLSASAYIRDFNISCGRYQASIDLKPALSADELDKRILSDFSKFKNRDFINSLTELLPSKIIPVIIRLSGIPERIKVCEIKKDDRKRLIAIIKDFRLTISKTRPIEEAIITAGGVDVDEINPSTMQSKIVEGLYIVGEMLDIDAYTGGFNLQIAFSTAYSAVKSLVQENQNVENS